MCTICESKPATHINEFVAQPVCDDCEALYFTAELVAEAAVIALTMAGPAIELPAPSDIDTLLLDNLYLVLADNKQPS